MEYLQHDGESNQLGAKPPNHHHFSHSKVGVNPSPVVSTVLQGEVSTQGEEPPDEDEEEEDEVHEQQKDLFNKVKRRI